MNSATKTDFQCYQTDALFLLMGRNPLPNYVAASMLLKPEGTLYLVHSTGPLGTGGYAQRLMERFPQYRPQLVGVNLSDTTDVRRQMQKYLQRTPSGRVGLNYTGGTKVMAVHTYQAVEEFCKRRGRDVVFSYLDADTLEMIIEPQPGQPAFRRKVVETVDLTLEDVFTLHGIRLLGKRQTDPLLPDLTRALAQMYSTPAGIQAWRKSREVLKECNGRSWQDVKSELLDAAATPDVLGHLERALNLKDPDPVNLDAAAKQVGQKSGGGLLQWLGGTWLENWALACVKELGYEHRARSLTGRADRKFEIDVALMRGYQLFALSCGVTTDRRSAKLKFFEIYTRARQMGGDEARAGLICAAEDPEGLEQEIAREWDAINRVRVFGSKHLPDLWIHLKSWFETV